jgi:putative transposase
MNPVAAEYRLSSARSHLEETEDMLASFFPLYNLIPSWKDLLHLSTEEELKILKRHEHTGRPLGRDSFVAELEKTLGRVLCSQKPGPKKKTAGYVYYPRNSPIPVSPVMAIPILGSSPS